MFSAIKSLEVKDFLETLERYSNKTRHINLGYHDEVMVRGIKLPLGTKKVRPVHKERLTKGLVFQFEFKARDNRILHCLVNVNTEYSLLFKFIEYEFVDGEILNLIDKTDMDSIHRYIENMDLGYISDTVPLMVQFIEKYISGEWSSGHFIKEYQKKINRTYSFDVNTGPFIRHPKSLVLGSIKTDSVSLYSTIDDEQVVRLNISQKENIELEVELCIVDRNSDELITKPSARIFSINGNKANRRLRNHSLELANFALEFTRFYISELADVGEKYFISQYNMNNQHFVQVLDSLKEIRDAAFKTRESSTELALSKLSKLTVQ